MNMTVYILSVLSLVVLIMIAVYITYKQVVWEEGGITSDPRQHFSRGN